MNSVDLPQLRCARLICRSQTGMKYCCGVATVWTPDDGDKMFAICEPCARWFVQTKTPITDDCFGDVQPQVGWNCFLAYNDVHVERGIWTVAEPLDCDGDRDICVKDYEFSHFEDFSEM